MGCEGPSHREVSGMCGAQALHMFLPKYVYLEVNTHLYTSTSIFVKNVC